MFGLGMAEIVIIGVLIVLLFGPSQIPRLGRAMGDTIKEVKKVKKELNREDDDE
jgi:sec-independent protein translocase protein TatA